MKSISSSHFFQQEKQQEQQLLMAEMTNYYGRSIASSSNQQDPLRRHPLATPLTFDEAAPPFLRSVAHPPLPSLPARHRIPLSVILNASTEDYFSNWTAGASPDTFMMYNPSLVVLPPSVRSDFNDNSKHNNRPDAEYLASFRLSSAHSCGFKTYAFWEKGNSRDLFGFALLDINLAVVPGSDVVIDLKKYYGRYAFQDVRIFVLGETIYLSHAQNLFPVRIVPSSDNNDISQVVTKESEHTQRIPNLFGNGMQMYRAGKALLIEEKGKNFQFFPKPSFANKGGGDTHINTNTNSTTTSSSSSSSWQVLMENWVANPRHVVEYNLSQPSSSTAENGLLPSWNVATDYMSSHSHPTAPTLPDGVGNDGWVQRDRGTACCVRVDSEYYHDLLPSDDNATDNESWWKNKNDGYVLVGVSHTKSRNRLPMKASQTGAFHYLSRLYAFSPRPPYQIVARSGLLCFGVGNETMEAADADNVDVDPYATLFSKQESNGTTRMFEFQGQSYTSCPRVHFVSGISEKAGDPSKMIVAYGVCDCYSRMVEVHKRDFAKSLFVEVSDQEIQ